jgi:hypothetical protein
VVAAADRRLAGPRLPRHEFRVSHETLSLSMVIQPRGTLRKQLTAYLRSRRKVRSPRMPHAVNGQGQLRDAVLIRLPNGRSSEAVLDALKERIGTLPQQLVRSLTWDQGKEMRCRASSRSTPDCGPTSAIRAVGGSRARTRTPTGCCARPSRRAPVSPTSRRSNSMPSPTS